MVSEAGAQVLINLREKTLRNLAQHISSSGRSVSERMGQIILLISNFQSHSNLMKQTIKLIRSVTQPNAIFPRSYTDTLDSAYERIQKLSLQSDYMPASLKS
uniref:Uncharacterized protein n=1 Tax=Ditylenchus dipsaci TaxID=166011 RepID=A0A915EKF3_9BILA